MPGSWLYWICGGVAVALGAYLLAVLLRPERYL